MNIRPDVRKGVEDICDSYAHEPSPLMMILSAIQKKYGYIPLEVQEVVSKKTGIPTAEIYGVVTFYSFFSLKPKGKYVIGCCLGTACYVKGSGEVLDRIQKKLGIEPGGTTPDGRFSLEATRCIGACGLAPVMTIDGEVHAKMTPEAALAILEELRRKEAETA